MSARLAQSVEHQTFNLRVEGSSPSLGAVFLYAQSRQDDVTKHLTLMCIRFQSDRVWVRFQLKKHTLCGYGYVTDFTNLSSMNTCLLCVWQLCVLKTSRPMRDSNPRPSD